jgi:anti-sigma-K factor RskA
MIQRDRTGGTHDCGGDAAAYVLGALEADEAQAFRKHLESCAVCRDEVMALQQVADALPMAAPQQPVPRGVRRRVLRAVRADARLQSSAMRRRWQWPSLALERPALALAATAAAAAAIFAGVEIGTSGSSGTRLISASVGNAEVRVSGSHADLLVRHLPPLAHGRIYEMWLQRGQQPPVSTHTLFTVTKNGTGEVGVPGSVKGVSRLMVTAEPAGGSLAPTTTPVIVASLG